MSGDAPHGILFNLQLRSEIGVNRKFTRANDEKIWEKLKNRFVLHKFTKAFNKGIQ